MHRPLRTLAAHPLRRALMAQPEPSLKGGLFVIPLVIVALVSVLLGLVVGAYSSRQATRESAYSEGWYDGYADARRPAL